MQEYKRDETLEQHIKREHSEEIDSTIECVQLTYKQEKTVSHTMTQFMAKKLKVSVIDAHVPGASELSLVYSTAQHGYSLSTLMAKAEESKGGACYVLCIIEEGSTEEEHERVFGAVLSSAPEYRKGAYGSTDTALFRFRTPKKQSTEGMLNSILNVYGAKPSENGFYVMAKKEYMAFGCSGGVFGLLVEKGLIRGESHAVETYKNEVLSHKEKFVIKHMELWQANI